MMTESGPEAVLSLSGIGKALWFVFCLLVCETVPELTDLFLLGKPTLGHKFIHKNLNYLNQLFELKAMNTASFLPYIRYIALTTKYMT